MTDEDPTPDPLAELRARIRETTEAAERLHGQAEDARRTDDAGGVPPRGWATPEDRRERADEVHALAQLLDTLRSLVPAELQAQVTDLVRQLLLLVRAIIDWWVDRLELDAPGTAGSVGPRGPAGAAHDATVEEIPID